MDPHATPEPHDDEALPEMPGDADLAGESLPPEAEGDAPPTPEVEADPTVGPEVEADPTVAPEAGAELPAPGAKGARRGPKPPRRPVLPEVPRVPLDEAQRAQARQAARERLQARSSRTPEQLGAALDALEAGLSPVFVARYRRVQTGGLDERALRSLRAEWQRVRGEEEHRVEMRELLRQRGGLTPEREQALTDARSRAAMEDVAAPYLPVPASRAFMARSLGLQGLADAIRAAAEGSELAALAQPFLKPEGQPATLDEALGGARDILAEELSLDPVLRAGLRDLYAHDGHLVVAVRSDKKGEAGRHAGLSGDQGPAGRVPPLKMLAIRRGERERVLSASVEPPEAAALALVHACACAAAHPHAGLLRAAAEDGYRRLLKPLLQREAREALRGHAEEQALDTFERTLRNLLLGPIGGARQVMGLRPDVTAGHRWCVVDGQGLPVASGTLPHEATAGRATVLDELREMLSRYEVQAVAVGSTGGKAEALGLLREALGERDLPLVVVHDGGVRAAEALGTLDTPGFPDVKGEHRGALSLARRFQDPLAELVTLEPKALALGPHMGDVHQGELRQLLDETIASCVAWAGVDAMRASVDLLARLPGFSRARAEAFAKARGERPLGTKAELAAWEGIGPEAALEAVGFLRLPQAADLRDRTQLHPEQYALVDAMAAQLGMDVQAFCGQPACFERLDLDALVGEGRPKALLLDVLDELAHGMRDPRPRFAVPIAPPEGTTLATLRPGLALEGRVTRVAPFGVFVDVGLEVEGLLPVPHIGDRPGVDPATVAPLGAVVLVRVLEVLAERRKLTLTMRSDARLPLDDRPARGPRGPRGPRREGGERGEPVGAGAPAGAGGGRREHGDRRGGRDDRRGGRDQRGPARPRMFSAAEGGESRPAERPARKPSGPATNGGAFGGRDPKRDLGLFDRGIKDEPGTPRRISLRAGEGKGEKPLTPEQALARKLAELMGGGTPPAQE